MPHNAPYRLPQTPGPPMLMVRLGSPVLMENNTLPLPRILRIMDIPDMPRILRLERHIIFLRQNNVKIRPIQPPDLFRPEHQPHPLSRTTPPVRPPRYPPPPQASPRQNTSHTPPPTASHSFRRPLSSLFHHPAPPAQPLPSHSPPCP